jgi:hypothetical protein
MEATITIETNTCSETEQDKQAYHYELGRYLGEGALYLTGSEASLAQAQNLTSKVNGDKLRYFAL